jgi:hypothetical protein
MVAKDPKLNRDRTVIIASAKRAGVWILPCRHRLSRQPILLRNQTEAPMTVHGVPVSHGVAGRMRRSLDRMQKGSLVHLNLQSRSVALYLSLYYSLKVTDSQVAVG